MKYQDIYKFKGDRYLLGDRTCVLGGIRSYSGGASSGDDEIWGVTVSIIFDDTGESTFAYLSEMKQVTDNRVRVGDLVDVRLADERTIRGRVVEIDREADLPYEVRGPDGGTASFAAWEFERFVRADAPERAAVSLAAVKERIRVLEVELAALRLSEEVLEGVYL